MGIMAQHIQTTLWGPPEPVAVPQPPDQPAAPAPEPLPPEDQALTDPRPDLAEDSELWAKLFDLAQKEAPYLATTLHGFRCMGTRIRRGRAGYVLRPDVDPTGDRAWENFKEYEEMRNRWLRPHAGKVAELLRRL